MKLNEVKDYQGWRRVQLEILEKRNDRIFKLFPKIGVFVFVASVGEVLIVLFVSSFFKGSPEFASFDKFMTDALGLVAAVSVVLSVALAVVYIGNLIGISKLRKEE